MKNLVGKKFGQLTVLEYSHTNAHREPFWVCRCDCGTIKTVIGASLKNGHTKSCGCFRRKEAIKRATKHGMNYTRIHVVWAAMKARCEDPNHIHYKNYGGRGIKVCDEWKKILLLLRIGLMQTAMTKKHQKDNAPLTASTTTETMSRQIVGG